MKHVTVNNFKKVCIQIGAILFISLILTSCGAILPASSTETPTATQSPIPTNTQQPSQTPTASNTPTITLTLPPTRIPKKVYYNQCNDPTIRVGQTISAIGHLVVPAGRYNPKAESFMIWLRFKPDSEKNFDIEISNGDGPNSMTLVPKIRDNNGDVLPWIKTQSGTEVFITKEKYNVIGIWQGNCVIQLEAILPE